MHASKSELALIRSLSQKKYRETEDKFIVEGWRSVHDALHSSYKIDLAVVLQTHVEKNIHEELLDRFLELRIPVKEITEKELNQISETVHSQGIVAVARKKKLAIDDILNGKKHLIVIGEGIADPGNLGSIVRCCDWFGVDALLLSHGCVELHNEKVVRSSAGSFFHLSVVENVVFSDVLPRLKKQTFAIIATAGDASSEYTKIDPARKICLIFGSEAHGVSEEVRKTADLIVKIPKFGKADSLNVGVTCGIILAHLKMQSFLRH